MNSQMVATFVAELNWTSIPDAAKERAKLTFRDTLGTMIGGGKTTAARIAAEVAAKEGGNGPALIVNTGRRTGRFMAAFANGVAASALDYDDGHYLGGAGHPGSVIISALLAAATGRDVPGRDFLTAQVAAYEVAIRAGHLLWPKSDTHQYHATGTMGAIGAAAGVARLFGLGAAEVQSAIGIGWTHAPMSSLGMPMAKEAIGWAACTAATAGILAEHGFKAGGSFGSRPSGVPFDRPEAQNDPFVGTIGQEFEAARTYFKPYAACRYTHAAADAFRQIIAEHELTADSIEAVEVHTLRRAIFLTEQAPQSLENAQYSFPFVLGAIACYDAAGPDQIAEERLSDPPILDVARRVTVHHDPSMDAEYPAHYGSEVRVITRSGARYSQRQVEATGEVARPLRAEDLRRKFLSLAVPRLGERDAKHLADVCDRFESASLSDVLDILTRAGVGV